MEGSTSCAPRFSSFSEEEKAALIEKVTPQSTKSATKFWVRVVCDFAREKALLLILRPSKVSSLVCWRTFIVRSERKMEQNTSGQATSLPVALYSVSWIVSNEISTSSLRLSLEQTSCSTRPWRRRNGKVASLPLHTRTTFPTLTGSSCVRTSPTFWRLSTLRSWHTTFGSTRLSTSAFGGTKPRASWRRRTCCSQPSRESALLFSTRIFSPKTTKAALLEAHRRRREPSRSQRWWLRCRAEEEDSRRRQAWLWTRFLKKKRFFYSLKRFFIASRGFL